MTISHSHDVLEDIFLINLEVHTWTGRKRLKPEDLGIDPSTLPPEKLASLGSKRIIDPEKIREFDKVKRRAERYLQKVALRFLGAYAVPIALADEVIRELEAFQRAYVSAKADFLVEYDQSVAAWIADNPEWAEIIAKAVTDKSYVENQIRFDFHVAQVASPTQSSNLPEKAVEHAKSAAKGLVGVLYEETASMAHKAFDESFLGRDRVTQKALRPINTILDKMESLAFLDAKVRPLTKSLRDRLDSLPRSGPIEGTAFSALLGVIGILKDEETLRAHGERMLAQPQPDETQHQLSFDDATKSESAETEEVEENDEVASPSVTETVDELNDVEPDPVPVPAPAPRIDPPRQAPQPVSRPGGFGAYF